METNLICKNTNIKFTLSENMLKRMKIEKDGKSIWIMYYDCPIIACNQRHYIQVDNNITKELLSDITKVLRHNMKRKRKGQNISKRQSTKYNKMVEELRTIRNELAKEINNSNIIDKDTNKFIIIS